jgi:hypothetical protein
MSNVKTITRDILAKFLPDQRSIVAMEKTLRNANEVLPDVVSNSDAVIAQLQTQINALSDEVAVLYNILSHIQRPVELGTIAPQQADSVDISGGLVSCQLKNNQNVLLESITALNNGAGGFVGTLANAPVAGNPTKWVPIIDNGVTRYTPAW